MKTTTKFEIGMGMIWLAAVLFIAFMVWAYNDPTHVYAVQCIILSCVALVFGYIGLYMMNSAEKRMN